MINIQKQNEPPELTRYKSSPGSCYDGNSFTSIKEAIRKSLLHEQGYICAYCMARITDDKKKTKIEHWHCQSGYPEEQLSYNNMLAVCYGNEKSPFEKHCDSKKTNLNLKFNPAFDFHNVQSLINYLGDGTILSTDDEFNKQLNTVLNLNCKKLINDRKQVLQVVIDIYNKNPGILKKLYNKYTKKSDGSYFQYCGIVIYFLNKKQKK